jgi:hypothetical protein
MLSGGFRFALPTLRSAMTKGKKEAERRQTCISTSASRDAARTGGCARLSAFHHGSYRQGFRPLGATPGQASWDVAGRSIRYGRPNRGAKISRSYTGVTRARLSQSRECTSRTGRSAGQHDARSCPVAECIVPPAGTALAPPLGIPSRQASLVSEIRMSEYLKRGQLSTKKRPAASDSLLFHRLPCPRVYLQRAAYRLSWQP